MTEYIIVPHGKREIADVTLKDGNSAKIMYDTQSKGYGDHNEDPFVRYQNAWFYSFCHSNVSLSKKVVEEKDYSNIIFVFLNPTIERGESGEEKQSGDTWIIDTVIQLKDIIKLEKDKNTDKDKSELYDPLKMCKVVKNIYKNKNVKVSQDDVKNIIAKYHLPKFEGESLENDRYHGDVYWSSEHRRPASPKIKIGVADMEKSYFPMEEDGNGEYVPVKIKSNGLTKIIKRGKNNGWTRYHVIKLFDDETLPDGKDYRSDLKRLRLKLDNRLDEAVKVKAKDIKSDAQGMIIPNKKKH